MRAVLFQQVGQPLELGTVADPMPAENQVLVRVARCGICGSDLHMSEGHGYVPPAGTIFGHEISGEIVEIGRNVEGVAAGDKIAVMPIFGCGHCTACSQGLPARCASMQFTSGGYAEYVAVDPTSAIRLPSTVSLDDAALAEPLAVALHGVVAARIVPGDVVTIVGAGPIGLAALFWARRFGAARTYVIEKVPERRAIAETMGATGVFLPEAPSSGDGFARHYGALPMGEAADVVVECVGRPGMLMAAAAYARHGARLVSLGYCFGDDPIVPAGLGMRELQLLFPQLYTRDEFEMSVNVLDRGAVEPRHMVTVAIGLDAVPEMFESLRTSPCQCKVMISPFQ
jgi:(R,R)-butanediol dehydrogenase/meso-butanediol dehydrogenase/diacetyl reductase